MAWCGLANETKRIASKPERRYGKIWWGPFPVWEDGDIVGSAHLDLITRKSTRVNLHINIYKKGKFPYFRKEWLDISFTTRLPLPAMKDLAKEIRKTGLRIRKLPGHRWLKRRFNQIEEDVNAKPTTKDNMGN